MKTSSSAQDRDHITALPAELLLAIANHIPAWARSLDKATMTDNYDLEFDSVRDILALRLTCKAFCLVATEVLVGILDRLYVRPTQRSLSIFRAVCDHPVFSKTVTTVVYIGLQYQYLASDSKAFKPCPHQKDSVMEIMGGLQEHKKRFKEQEKILDAEEDIHALTVGLAQLPNVSAVHYANHLDAPGFNGERCIYDYRLARKAHQLHPQEAVHWPAQFCCVDSKPPGRHRLCPEEQAFEDSDTSFSNGLDRLLYAVYKSGADIASLTVMDRDGFETDFLGEQSPPVMKCMPWDKFTSLTVCCLKDDTAPPDDVKQWQKLFEATSNLQSLDITLLGCNCIATTLAEIQDGAFLPHLQTLTLRVQPHNSYISQDIDDLSLGNFLLRHRSTLRHLYVHNIGLLSTDEDCWLQLFEKLRGGLQLDKAVWVFDLDDDLVLSSSGMSSLLELLGHPPGNSPVNLGPRLLNAPQD